MHTAIYARVSTEEQANEGFSIHAQKDKLTKIFLIILCNFCPIIRPTKNFLKINYKEFLMDSIVII